MYQIKMKGKTLLCTLASLTFAFATVFPGDACTNVIVTRGASADGSGMVSYAADSHWLYGELYFKPAADWKAGSMRKVYDWDSGRYLGDIEEIAHTYKRVGNMNEHQLIIGETTFGGREELMDTHGGIDYGSLIYIALERCKTAREAIECMTGLANEYGYYSEGESFSIVDKTEAWILEMIGKGTVMRNGRNLNKGVVWVARRIPDGMISAHANQARITTFPLQDPENSMPRMSFLSPAGWVTSMERMPTSASPTPTARSISAACAPATPGSGALSTSSATAGSPMRMKKPAVW